MKKLTWVILLSILGLLLAFLAVTLPRQIVLAARTPSLPQYKAASEWGKLVVWEDVTTTYDVYSQTFVYGDSPFLITDVREGSKYSDKESYEIRALDVYRAANGSQLFEGEPVIFFVHGGAWTDGYRNWYSFVAQSFTGEMGWTTVVIDYRLTSDQVFLADADCPDREHCTQDPAQKAAWYPDNLTDAADAFQWVTANIAANGGNPGKIVIFGHSAGGHLVSLLASHPDHAALRPKIQAVISMSGAYSLTVPLTIATLASDIDQTFPGGHLHNDAELREASPMNYIEAGVSLPPFYLLHAQLDLPSFYEQKMMFMETLESAEATLESDYLTGYTHETEMESIADVNAAPTRFVINYVEKVLGLKLYLPIIRR